MISYKTLEERVINSYSEQSAIKFIRNDKSKLSEKDQEILFDFTKGIFLLLQKSPELLFSEFHNDDAHPNRFHLSSYNKSDLKKHMRKAFKAIDDFMYIIYSIGLDNEIKIPKKYLELYSAIEIENNIKIHDILKQFIGKEKLPFHNFIRCMYNENYQYFTEIFVQFTEDLKAYKRLIKWLKDNEYTYIPFLVNSEVRNSESSGMGLYKKVNGNVGNMPFSIYDHSIIGMFMDYNALIQEPAVFSLRVQNIKEILRNFNELNEKLKDFIINYHSRCNGCNYCIQRHLKRTKNIKPLAISVEYNNKIFVLCPINYVYSYSWTTLNDKIVNGVIAYLDLMEKEHNI
ncbi:MAG: hypothetical protein LBC96_02490 [Lachnospiraceae bacterium]|jgi:hypothetical protein|nr:hypothetical protein [Lachnospiraceae bacterium]